MPQVEAAYADRAAAGRRLADRLARYAREPAVVLALPRGGVPVALPIAERLGVPLDVFAVRKVGAPGDPEYGIGAVAEGGVVLLDHSRIAHLGLTASDLELEVRDSAQEVEAQVRLYRAGRPMAPVERRVVILVDDGLATGVTARAAVRALRMRRPRRVVVAVGVAAPDALLVLARDADEVVCPCVPDGFRAVGEWYNDFSEVSDATVVSALARHRELRGPSALDA